MTKHEKILKYIKDLKVGSRISVRQLAQDLQVSEGTAYRAIKDAQLKGLVSTIPRIGTIRIEQADSEDIEKLTYAEVVNIVEGSVLGGITGLHRPLKKFLIGAMEVRDMQQYVEQGDLLIVGNRKEAQILALNMGAAVLITGGFQADDDVVRLADEKEMPLITSPYDTYTVATIINRAIFTRLLRKDVIRVKDVMVQNPYYLDAESTVGDWRKLLRATRHSRFPVVNSEREVIGIVTTKDVADLRDELPIVEIMTKDPIMVGPDTPVAHAAHLMVWEGIELIPVVEDRKLVGVISRQDAIRAFRSLIFQPQIAETVDNLIMGHFSVSKTESGVRLHGKTGPIMLNPYGITSYGSLITAMVNAGFEAFRSKKRPEIIPDSLTVYFSRPVQLEEEIEINVDIIEIGRKSGKVEINLFHEDNLVAKAIMSVKVLGR
ncbi:DRTGG domain-containing protein [Thermosediminibacter litoriperuensis]|uniref:Putative transcriptional regulator n=1 Tax=Thermosediminibacter litoriperuensis TaxID=291989 RepID=A0A5S5AUZ5_9FIRM|nr:DRTGG domain-containing protein [Thermosediminibacter litoriperuensis]TYP56710.1 putative transcriptional regulator [Thermosediminibacter litoriperuensis]